MDATQLLAAILGVLFVVAFVIERWFTAHRWKAQDRDRKPWWQEPPDDGPEGDY